MNELTLHEGLSDIQKYNQQDLNAITKSNAFLPRVQLMTSQSEKCKSGEFPINNFALINGKNHIDLGKETDIIILGFRPKAMDMSGDEVIAVYDRQADKDNNSTGEFKRIEDRSFVQNSSCMFGPEFLIWVPSQKSFATFFCGGVTLRREAPNFGGLMYKAGTLKSTKIETKKFTYYSTVITPCSNPNLEIPSQESVFEQVKAFNNPQAVVVERVEAAPASGDRAV